MNLSSVAQAHEGSDDSVMYHAFVLPPDRPRCRVMLFIEAFRSIFLDTCPVVECDAVCVQF